MPSPISFGPFRLDRDQRLLLRGEAAIALRRKAWEVLCHLVERPGAVVSNDELLDAVWPGIAVTPQTVSNVIRELRVALADRAGGARWIQTLRGRGHVFRPDAPGEPADEAAVVLVGRERERARLEAAWAGARRGEPRLVLVSGEPGIGKTTLVDSFAATLLQGSAAPPRFGRGAGVEQHGRPESFLPALCALGQVAAGTDAREVVATLRRTAPAWLIRLPDLLRPDERLRIEPTLVGATSTRMLREGLGAVRALAESQPLVLILEDLHWSDPATLDLLAALARTPAPLRLLLVATFRRVDAAIRAHPVTELARELVREGRAEEIALAPFDACLVEDYLHARLGPGHPPADLATRLEQLSAGNPLFLRSLVDDLAESGAFLAGSGGWELACDAERLLADLPESLRAFVASESARLPHPLRRLVEAASVIGDAVLVPELATTLGRPEEEIAAACEQLASVGRLLRRAGEAPWQDGALVARYAFPHASHRRVVYEGLPAHDRRALHRRLALGLEAGFGARAPAIAARLAAHLDEGGLFDRAVHYHDLASTAAEARFAYGEAVAHLAAALEHLDRAAGPDGDASPRAGLLCLRLGELSVLAHGYSRSEVEHAYARALAIFEHERMPLGIFTADMGLAVVDLTRARYQSAQARTARLAAIAAGESPELSAIASCWTGFACSALGELDRARAALEAGIAAGVEPALPRNFSVSRMLRSQLALVTTVQGDRAAAARHEADALARSRRHGAVSEVAHAGLLAAERAIFLADARGRASASEALALAEANGLVSYLALLRVYDSALAVGAPPRERLAVMRSALDERTRLGDRWHTALLLGLLAGVALEAGEVAGARSAVDDAFRHVAESGERYYEAELCRLRAECALAPGATAARVVEARTWLERGVAIASHQGARLWKERARARLETLPAPGPRRRRTQPRSGRRPASGGC